MSKKKGRQKFKKKWFPIYYFLIRKNNQYAPGCLNNNSANEPLKCKFLQWRLRHTILLIFSMSRIVGPQAVMFQGRFPFISVPNAAFGFYPIYQTFTACSLRILRYQQSNKFRLGLVYTMRSTCHLLLDIDVHTYNTICQCIVLVDNINTWQ